MNVIEVYGTRRSGHHGIIGWLKHNFDAKYGKKKVFYLNDLTNNHGLQGVALDIKIEEIRNNGAEYLFVSYEDEFTSTTRIEGPTKKIVVIRDIINNAASRYKAHPHGAMEIKDRYVNIWKEHAVFPAKIRFEDFIANKEVRDSFSLSLGVENIDVTDDMIYCSNNGSSFVSKTKDTIENYLTRYKMVEIPESKLQLINTPDINQLRFQLGYISDITQ